jgi:hypothetical protein
LIWNSQKGWKLTRETKYHFKWHVKGVPIGKKKFWKVRDKWQRKILGVPIYVTFGSPLFFMLPNYVPNGNIVFHGSITLLTFYFLI